MMDTRDSFSANREKIQRSIQKIPQNKPIQEFQKLVSKSKLQQQQLIKGRFSDLIQLGQKLNSQIQHWELNQDILRQARRSRIRKRVLQHSQYNFSHHLKRKQDKKAFFHTSEGPSSLQLHKQQLAVKRMNYSPFGKKITPASYLGFRPLKKEQFSTFLSFKKTKNKYVKGIQGNLGINKKGGENCKEKKPQPEQRRKITKKSKERNFSTFSTNDLDAKPKIRSIRYQKSVQNLQKNDRFLDDSSCNIKKEGNQYLQYRRKIREKVQKSIISRQCKIKQSIKQMEQLAQRNQKILKQSSRPYDYFTIQAQGSINDLLLNSIKSKISLLSS